MTENKKELLKANLLLSHASVLKWHADIISGNYKNRNLFHGTEKNGKPFTDEEKLLDAAETIGHHLSAIQEYVKQLAKDANQSKTSNHW